MPDDQNRWRGHPVLATGLRLLIIAIPLLAGYLASVVGVRLMKRQLLETHWWLVAIAAASIVVCFAIERLTRRLLPLAALLKLSMLFPDRAPSRFRLARGAVSTRLLNERVAKARTRDAAATAEAVLELITAMTAHDRRTRGHCERVRVFTELLADQLRLPRDAKDKLRWVSLLHDVGKLQVAPEILNKPAKLNDTEWKVVAQHPERGEELLGPLLDWLGEWGTAVRHHHESYDGTGYPDRLAGDEIGRAARIVAVTDSYEVMTAHRAYKKPMATVAARAELARCAGTQFDPVYVRAFLSISLPRLLWAMGPGALAMNLPLLRVLAQSTSQGLAVIPQGVVAAGAAAVVAGSVAVSPVPPASAAQPVSISAPISQSQASTGGPGGSASGTPTGTIVLAPLPSGTTPGGPSGADPGASATPTASGSGTPAAPQAPIAPQGVSGIAAPIAPVAPVAPVVASSSSAAAAPSMAAPTLVSTPPASGAVPIITFNWAQVSGLNYEYQLDSGGWTVLGATSSYTTVVLIGTHTFRLRARAGSGGPTPTTSYTFTVLV